MAFVGTRDGKHDLPIVGRERGGYWGHMGGRLKRKPCLQDVSRLLSVLSGALGT